MVLETGLLISTQFRRSRFWSHLQRVCPGVLLWTAMDLCSAMQNGVNSYLNVLFELQKKEGCTEWFISVYATSLTIKMHSYWVSTCLDKWFTWNTQCSRAHTLIHMALTRTASCGQSSNMFSLHLWHMKPYGIIYPLGRDHFQTGRFSDTIISCGVPDQEQAEIGRKQKGAYIVLKGHVKNFVFKSSFKLVLFF